MIIPLVLKPIRPTLERTLRRTLAHVLLADIAVFSRELTQAHHLFTQTETYLCHGLEAFNNKQYTVPPHKWFILFLQDACYVPYMVASLSAKFQNFADAKLFIELAKVRLKHTKTLLAPSLYAKTLAKNHAEIAQKLGALEHYINAVETQTISTTHIGIPYHLDLNVQQLGAKLVVFYNHLRQELDAVPDPLPNGEAFKCMQRLQDRLREIRKYWVILERKFSLWEPHRIACWQLELKAIEAKCKGILKTYTPRETKASRAKAAKALANALAAFDEEPTKIAPLKKTKSPQRMPKLSLAQLQANANATWQYPIQPEQVEAATAAFQALLSAAKAKPAPQYQLSAYRGLASIAAMQHSEVTQKLLFALEQCWHLVKTYPKLQVEARLPLGQNPLQDYKQKLLQYIHHHLDADTIPTKKLLQYIRRIPSLCHLGQSSLLTMLGTLYQVRYFSYYCQALLKTKCAGSKYQRVKQALRDAGAHYAAAIKIAPAVQTDYRPQAVQKVGFILDTARRQMWEVLSELQDWVAGTEWAQDYAQVREEVINGFKNRPDFGMSQLGHDTLSMDDSEEKPPKANMSPSRQGTGNALVLPAYRQSARQAHDRDGDPSPSSHFRPGSRPPS